ncbi:MAG: hypothetical protein ACLP3B_05230 [Syntrophobacteraceae bacterium]
MSVLITSYKPYQKNTLQGFATIRLTNIGFEIRDVTIHQKNGSRWIQLPAKLVQRPADQGGDHWFAIVDFYDKARKDQFQAAVLSRIGHLLSEGQRGRRWLLTTTP